MLYFHVSHYPVTLWSLTGYICGIFQTQTALLFSPGSSGMEKVASHCEFLMTLRGNMIKNSQWRAFRVGVSMRDLLKIPGGIPIDAER